MARTDNKPCSQWHHEHKYLMKACIDSDLCFYEPRNQLNKYKMEESKKIRENLTLENLAQAKMVVNGKFIKVPDGIGGFKEKAWEDLTEEDQDTLDNYLATQNPVKRAD